MKRIFSLLLKLLKLCIIIITTMFLAVWFGGRWILSFSVAEYEGEIHVSDIHHPIEITFDAKEFLKYGRKQTATSCLLWAGYMPPNDYFKWN